MFLVATGVPIRIRSRKGAFPTLNLTILGTADKEMDPIQPSLLSLQAIVVVTKDRAHLLQQALGLGKICASVIFDVKPHERNYSQEQKLIPPTIACARALRDGGIDAMAALNEGLREAIAGASAVHAQELRRMVARVMAEISDEFISPAVSAFPELDPDEGTWIAIAKTRAGVRFNTAM